MRLEDTKNKEDPSKHLFIAEKLSQDVLVSTCSLPVNANQISSRAFSCTPQSNKSLKCVVCISNIASQCTANFVKKQNVGIPSSLCAMPRPVEVIKILLRDDSSCRVSGKSGNIGLFNDHQGEE